MKLLLACLVCSAALVALEASPLRGDVAMLEETTTPAQRHAAIKSLEGIVNAKAPTAAQVGAKVAAKWQKKMNQMEMELKKEVARYKIKADNAKRKEKIKLFAQMNAVKENAKKEIAKARAGGLSPQSIKIAQNAAARVVNAESKAMHAQKMLGHVTKQASFAHAASGVIRRLRAKLGSNAKIVTTLSKTLKKSQSKIGKLQMEVKGLKTQLSTKSAKKTKKKAKCNKACLLAKAKKQRQLAKAAHHRAAKLHSQNASKRTKAHKHKLAKKSKKAAKKSEKAAAKIKP